MKAPKEMRTYCRRCNGHTIHTVSVYKRGKERATSWGARRHAKRKKGYGGQKYPELRRPAKTTKKLTLKLKCRECGMVIMKEGIRLRKLEVARS